MSKTRAEMAAMLVKAIDGEPEPERGSDDEKVSEAECHNCGSCYYREHYYAYRRGYYILLFSCLLSGAVHIILGFSEPEANPECGLMVEVGK